MFDWLNQHHPFLWFLAAASLALFLISLLIMPALIVRIPPDYFAHKSRPPSPWDHRHTLIQFLIALGKNLLGLFLILAGIAMLLLPGQGILTIFFGFLLLDFPGKYRLEKWLVAKPLLQKPINWLRHRRGREPLQLQRSA